MGLQLQRTCSGSDRILIPLRQNTLTALYVRHWLVQQVFKRQIQLEAVLNDSVRWYIDKIYILLHTGLVTQVWTNNRHSTYYLTAECRDLLQEYKSRYNVSIVVMISRF